MDDERTVDADKIDKYIKNTKIIETTKIIGSVVNAIIMQSQWQCK